MKKTEFEHKYLGSCSVCGVKFQGRNTEVLSRKPDISHIYAQCARCKSSTVVFILRNTSGFVTTIGMLTDMKKKDILRFRKMNPITGDDVLDLHRILEKQ
ncbi:MAG: hypothetical protein WD850_02255 [Candidatus Spechtbacterales bacterium]